MAKAIVDDYQDFITRNKLYPFQGVTGFYEDGHGCTAVDFQADGDNESWHFVLIYNSENKRIKVVKFDHHRYMC